MGVAVTHSARGTDRVAGELRVYICIYSKIA
jgi:hypothetical protein